MFKEKDLTKFEKNEFDSNLTRPSLNGFNFANIFPTIEKILGKKTEGQVLDKEITSFCQKKNPQKIVFFLIDAFGFSLIDKFANKHEFYKKILKNGKSEMITSQFPSTTSACVTTAHSMDPVGVHGVYEWYFREKNLNQIISPLLYSFGRDGHNRETLKKAYFSEKLIFPKENFYQKLAKSDIQSYVFQHGEYLDSTYSNYMFKGAETFGYKTLSEGLNNLFETLNNNSTQKEYYFFYFDKIDSLSHKYGPSSKVVEWELNSLLNNLLIFQNKLPDDVLMMMSADHGQIDINLEDTFYLNLEFPELVNYLEVGNDGLPLIPAGSARDAFLYVRPEYLDLVEEKLKRILGKKALVLKTSQLIQRGYFGKKVGQNLKDNVGNLVILPKGHNSIWWYEKDRLEVNKRGHHGGLTKEEMFIPLLII